MKAKTNENLNNPAFFVEHLVGHVSLLFLFCFPLNNLGSERGICETQSQKSYKHDNMEPYECLEKICNEGLKHLIEMKEEPYLLGVPKTNGPPHCIVVWF